ncbi:MetQ/NlpA family ABC transporter substrate-binding protein [Aminiphilus sp.]|uniref:MetQ/NlpA family ABC transporter substrate-binding protein n=1 Tax=Aminiphilus sp. TaxID=1872488 RepID=UPI002614E3CA|nr:MetQ/NlpA family ABC transporter substrate-binding protein [Aminiphilus sp.]
MRTNVVVRAVVAAVAFVLCVAAGGTRSSAEELEKLRVGATAGPHAEVLEFVREGARTRGIDLEVVEFSDYIAPNAALDQGDLDANSYQHQFFLDTQNKDRGYHLVSIAKTVVCPLGFYSKRIKDIAELKDGATVAVPNDPANVGRALVLLERQGFITLQEGLGYRASVLDIVANPKKLRIVEIEAPQLPRSLDDVDLGAVNVNYAVEAGLSPMTDALLIEDPATSPFANLIVVREADKDRPVFRKLVEAYQTEDVKRFMLERFKGAFVPAW